MNLYQKIRPQTWDEIIGQENIVEALRNRIIKKNHAQVIYFIGPSGIGKSTIARIWAKSLLCRDINEKGNPCNTCPSCKDIINEQFKLSCYEYNCSNLRIDEVRNIENLTKTKSIFNKAKIFFFDEFQNLDNSKKDARDALLKLLEKNYHGNCYFILGSVKDIEKNIVTEGLLNRTIQYRLKPIPKESIENHLIDICKKENIVPNEKQLLAIQTLSDMSNGSLRNAISYLERCIDSDIWDTEYLRQEFSLEFDEQSSIKLLFLLLNGDNSLLNNEIDKDGIISIRRLCLFLYKHKLNIKIGKARFLFKEIFDKFSVMKVRNTLRQLNKIDDRTYLTKEFIDFLLLEIIEENKINNNTTIPIRQRKKV